MKNIYLLYLLFCFLSCSGQEETIQNNELINNPKTLNYLALGDSYTIGESVCETCRFPEQLKNALKNGLSTDIKLKIIARTGWTTTRLLEAIAEEKPNTDFDLVTLLIGVNNQYQGKPFETYEQEFPQLLNKAIEFAKGKKNRVIVVSIPDYAYTPFGQGRSDAQQISEELDRYNAFAKLMSENEGVSFINITDITRLGLEQPVLVASDGLHPSELAYFKFVERLLPVALKKLKD